MFSLDCQVRELAWQQGVRGEGCVAVRAWLGQTQVQGTCYASGPSHPKTQGLGRHRTTEKRADPLSANSTIVTPSRARLYWDVIMTRVRSNRDDVVRLTGAADRELDARSGALGRRSRFAILPRSTGRGRLMWHWAKVNSQG